MHVPAGKWDYTLVEPFVSPQSQNLWTKECPHCRDKFWEHSLKVSNPNFTKAFPAST